MSLVDLLKPFSALSVPDLVRALQHAGCATAEAEAGADELLKLVSGEALAIGVEDLLQKASEGTRAQLGVKTSEELESRAKRDLLGFLEGLPGPLARQLASEAGIKTEEADAEQLRVRLFEETVLLGAEGLLDLQEEPLLRTLLRHAGGAAGAGEDKTQLVEALMVKMFDLKEREPAAKKARPVFASKSEVTKLKVAELRALCQERGLSAEGLKADLVERVWAAQK